VKGEANLGAIGEFGLIDRIRAAVGAGTALVGIGDDAAVLENNGGPALLATVDMLVEGIHFPSDAPPHELGARALAVSLSDIAAMGGTPTASLVSLALPAETPLTYVDSVYRGLAEAAARWGTSIVGGNLSRSPGPRIIDVVQLGLVDRDRVALRSGAQPGDAVAVTGVLGWEAAERALTASEVRHFFRVPEPRLAAGRAVASQGLVTAMMDISDGLAADLHHLVSASGVGAVVYADRLPVAIQAREAGERSGGDALDFALYGGEDYELLMTVRSSQVQNAVEATAPVPLTVIGTVLPPEQGVTLETPGGQRRDLPPGGWRHF
jgi:thiamine-monophosphate kinase